MPAKFKLPKQVPSSPATPADLARIELESRIRDADLAFESRFPVAYHGVTAAREDQRAAFGKLVAAFAEWRFTPEGKAPKISGAILDGKTGQGKTALACLLCKFAATKGLRSAYISARDLDLDLRGLPSARRKDVQTYLEEAAEADLVLIDDAGAEKRNEEARKVISYLLEDVLRTNRFVIGTTNLKREEYLLSLGDERDWSRLLAVEWIHLDDAVPDYRGRA